MNIVTALQEFFGTEAGLLAKSVLVLSFVDFVFGVLAAFRDGTFRVDAIGAFIGKHIGARALPILLLLFVGHFANEGMLLVAGVTLAGIYATETAKSVIDSIRQAMADPRRPVNPEDSVPANPIPVG